MRPSSHERAGASEWSATSTDFPDSHRDLLDARLATLATLGKDGGPQLTEVWFPFRARRGEDLAERLAAEVGANYGGADLRDHDGLGDLRTIVTIDPTNVFAVDMSA